MTWIRNWFIWESGFCQFRDNFFDSQTLAALSQNIIDADERKREFKLWEIPSDLDTLTEAMKFAREQIKVAFNTAILKKYVPWEWSWAYDWHVDPERFSRGPLWICTLAWESELWVRKKDGMRIDIATIPNRFILADSQLEHRAQPPKNPDKVRTFLFLWKQ